MERFSPKVWTLGLKIGAIYVQRGINNFDDWSAKMAESCGTKIEPWLSAIWATLESMPKIEKFNDKQIGSIAEKVGKMYETGTTNIKDIGEDFTRILGADMTNAISPMIRANYRGIKRYFDDLEGKTSNAIKPKVIASGVCGENLTWTLDDDGTLTISGTGEMETYWDYQKKPWYAQRELIQKIILKDGVTTIGYTAFEDCVNLQEITIPDSVKMIDGAAFSHCGKLKSITIPEGVKTIYPFTFSLCYSLIEVNFPDSIKHISYSAFSYCESLIIIRIPSSVTEVGENIFKDCTSLEKIYYPVGRDFEENLSQGNNAKLIPYDVAPSAIEAGTRGICGKNLIWTLDDDGTLTISGTGEMKSYPQVQNLPWFNYRERIKNVVIDFGVTSISERVFWNCKSLTKITISDSVVSIGERTFWSCNSLIEINIPISVVSIGGAPFKGCVYLKKIYYPAGRDFEKILSAGNTAELVPY